MRWLMSLGVLPALLVATAASAAPSPYPFAEAVRVRDFLFLSGQIGIAPGASAPVPGGVTAETRQAMENIGATLRKHGLGYRDLVKCTVMLTDMSQWQALNRVYATYFPDGHFPARSAFGAAALALGAKVEIECLAQYSSRPEGINATTPLGPYSQAVRSGGTVYISGVVPFDAATGRFAAADIASQMRQLLANLDAVLAAAGLDRSSIVKTTLFLRSASDMPAANAAYGAYFSGAPKPARTTVAGADWGRPELIVEMDAVADGSAKKVESER